MVRRMKRHLPTATRLLLGLTFAVFGLNYFLHFLPMPAMPPDQGLVLGALVGVGYLPVVKVLELAAAAALLGNRLVPLALLVLAPIEIAIAIFHLRFDGAAGLPMPLLLIALTAHQAWVHRATMAPLLRLRPA